MYDQNIEIYSNFACFSQNTHFNTNAKEIK